MTNTGKKYVITQAKITQKKKSKKKKTKKKKRQRKVVTSKIKVPIDCFRYVMTQNDGNDVVKEIFLIRKILIDAKWEFLLPQQALNVVLTSI